MGKILIFNAETNEWEYNSTGTGELAADIQFTDTAKGVILKAPDGDRWRITVDNSGNLVTTNLDL
jgi:hypothetical protein